METYRQVDRALHDEHMHVEGLLRRLEATLRPGIETLLEPDPGARRLLGDLIGVLDGGLARHFRFEEEVLFPRLAADGAEELTSMLQEDHQILLPLAADLREGLRTSLDGGMDATAAEACRRLALEFVERQTDHIEKEEMALPPALAEALDDDEDREIAMTYQAT